MLPSSVSCRGLRARLLRALLPAILPALLAPPAAADLARTATGSGSRWARSIEDRRREAEKQALVPHSNVLAPPPAGNVVQGNAASLCFPPDGTYTLSMPPNDDGSSGLIPLPFTFDLYGDTYTSLYINNNGNVSFVEPFFTYTPDGFPTTRFRMVAPFWADVDTRGGFGTVSHKIFSNKMVVTWDNVGYYSIHGDKLNTFQLAISDGTDPEMGLGNNVCFCYDDMAWTTGDASGGSGGFGGTPATVGVNRGNGVEFFQVGRFDHPGSDYDGPFGSSDGVSYLDGQHFCLNTSSANIPPIPANFPPDNEITVTCPGVLDREVQFLAPEAGQTVTVTVTDVDGAQALGLAIVNTPGNPARVRLAWAPPPGSDGDYRLDFLAVDDFSPPGETGITLTIHVTDCGIANQPPTCSAGPAVTAQCRTAVIDGATVLDPDGDAIAYSWSGAGMTFDPPGGTIPAGEGERAVPSTTVTLNPEAPPCDLTLVATLSVDDLRGGSSSCATTVTFDDNAPPTIEPGAGTAHCLWPPNHRMECFASADFAPTVSDGCGGPVTWSFVGCFSDQCDDAPCAGHPGENGDGNTTGDCSLSADGSQICFRAERAGTHPDGRTYALMAVATDDCGNTSEPAMVGMVHVPHDQSARRGGGCS